MDSKERIWFQVVERMTPMTALRRDQAAGLKPKGPGGIGHANRKPREWRFLVVWEFQARPALEKRFKLVYGPNGDWVRLFRQDECYIRTELVRDVKSERTYVTLDYWTSQKAYDAFRARHLDAYKALDHKCEGLTASEREIGRFVRASNE
jgi:quinol monooxygenase YgiN